MAAVDGQTLSTQSDQTKRDFAAVYGGNADAAWEAQHNASVSPGPSQAPAPPSSSAGPALSAAAPDSQAGPASQASAAMQAAQLADQQASRALAASTAANAQTFAESVRQFNESHALALQTFGLQQEAQKFSQALQAAGQTGQYNGQQTQAAQQQQFSQAATTAGLTGWFAPPGGAGGAGATGGWQPPTQQQAVTQRTAELVSMGFDQQRAYQTATSEFNQGLLQSGNVAGGTKVSFAAPPGAAGATGGPPGSVQTLAGQAQQANLSGMYQGNPTEAARQFNTTTGMDLTRLGASLSGPADYFKFNNAMNGGRSIIDSLSGSQARPAFSAPVGAGANTPLSLGGIMDRLGISKGGGTGFGVSPGSSPPGGSGTPGSQSSGGLSLPNGMGSIPFPHQVNPAVWDSWGKTGQEFIKSAAAAAGFDPNEYESQINATRPGTMTKAPAGASAYSSGGASAY